MTAATEIDTSDEKYHPFSRPDFTKFPPRVIATEGYERLFGHYTGVSDTYALYKYLLDFQTKALKVHPYGCISNGGFAALRERAHDEYPNIIEYAKKGGQLYVDLGCCLGTDVREFLLDGGDAKGSNRLIAVDLRQDFIDLGQELFKGPTPGIEFRTANFLESSDKNLDDLKGKVTLLYTGAVFHLFNEENQRTFANKIASLIARDKEVVVFGLHRGAAQKGPREHRSGGILWCHDPQSWKEMWTEVLGEDAKNWTMRAKLRDSWTAAEYVTAEHPVLQWSLWRKQV